MNIQHDGKQKPITWTQVKACRERVESSPLWIDGIGYKVDAVNLQRLQFISAVHAPLQWQAINETVEMTLERSKMIQQKWAERSIQAHAISQTLKQKSPLILRDLDALLALISHSTSDPKR